MIDPNRKSKLVELVMPNARQEEIAEATERWFGFLEIIDRLVLHKERQESDSPTNQGTDRIE